MPLPKALLEEMQRRRAEEAHVARGDTRRDLTITALACVASAAVGLALLAIAFHTSSYAVGRVFFIGGQIVGYAGISVSLVRAYLRGERRGDW